MADISYVCPACRNTVTVHARAAGKTLPCPQCGAKAVVPVAPPTRVQREEFDFQEQEEASSSRRGGRKRINGARFALWLFFFTVTRLIEGIRILFGSGGSPEDSQSLIRLREIGGTFLFFMLCFAVDRMLGVDQGG